MGGCGFCCSSHRCELCRKTYWIHSVSECTFVLLSWCGLLMWMGKTFSSGANIDQFAVCQLFVLAVNLDLACPLSFGKKHRRDLTNKSITGRTLVEEHFSPHLRTGRQRLTSSMLIAKFSWSAFKSDKQQWRQCVYSTGYRKRCHIHVRYYPAPHPSQMQPPEKVNTSTVVKIRVAKNIVYLNFFTLTQRAPAMRNRWPPGSQRDKLQTSRKFQ